MSTPQTIELSTVDPYEVIGVAPTASQEQITQAYFARVRESPPERDPAGFKRLRAAYDRVKTPEKRLETDMTRFAPWPEPELPAAPPLDLSVSRDDVFRAARAFSDLARTEWREDYREISL